MDWREREDELERMRGKGTGENKGNRELRKGRKKDWRGWRERMERTGKGVGEKEGKVANVHCANGNII
jgi:hypothetical protein